MRRIGKIEDEAKAREFGDFLLAQGIENEIDEDGSAWAIWVVREDQLDTAEKEFQAFRENPDDPKYGDAGRRAEQIRRDAEREEKRRRRMNRDLRQEFNRGTLSRSPAMVSLLVISVAVALVTRLGSTVNDPIIGWLSFASYATDGFRIEWYGLREITHGQIWRIFTPMFIHFGALHILFNMIWLYDLGGQIENRKGSWFLLVMVLIIAGLSNTAQYFVSGPAFGGMSGVVYGLFGYIWMKMKFQPEEGLGLSQTTVTIMLIWFVVCLLGVVGSVANTVHFVGLVVGMAFGYAATARRRLERR